jgi:hypothetical protein
MSTVRGAGWRTGIGRLGVALSVVWIIGWGVYFTYLVAAPESRPEHPLDYLTYLLIVLAPPGALFLIAWVIKGFRANP